MALIYITGIPGSGKSTVGRELSKRGYVVYDIDDELAAFYDNESGKEVARPLSAAERTPTWRAQHSWKLPRDKVDKLVAESRGNTVFLCGTVANDVEIRDLFSHVIALVVDKDILIERITARAGDGFGKVPHELELAVQMQKTAEHEYRTAGAIIINAERPY